MSYQRVRRGDRGRQADDVGPNGYVRRRRGLGAVATTLAPSTSTTTVRKFYTSRFSAPTTTKAYAAETAAKVPSCPSGSYWDQIEMQCVPSASPAPSAPSPGSTFTATVTGAPAVAPEPAPEPEPTAKGEVRISSATPPPSSSSDVTYGALTPTIDMPAAPDVDPMQIPIGPPPAAPVTAGMSSGTKVALAVGGVAAAAALYWYLKKKR